MTQQEPTEATTKSHRCTHIRTHLRQSFMRHSSPSGGLPAPVNRRKPLFRNVTSTSCSSHTQARCNSTHFACSTFAQVSFPARWSIHLASWFSYLSLHSHSQTASLDLPLSLRSRPTLLVAKRTLTRRLLFPSSSSSPPPLPKTIQPNSTRSILTSSGTYLLGPFPSPVLASQTRTAILVLVLFPHHQDLSSPRFRPAAPPLPSSFLGFPVCLLRSDPL